MCSCPVCAHVRREEIDATLLAGEGVREIAARFGGFSKSTAQKHRSGGHVAKPGERSPADDEVLERIHALIEDVEAGERFYSKRAGRSGDNRGAIAGMRELRETARLLADLAGKLKTRTEVNLVLSPQWASLLQRMMEALWPYSEARLAVARALSEAKALPPAPGGLSAWTNTRRIL